MTTCKVIREFINRSELYEIDRKGEFVDYESLYDYEDLPNEYWAILADDGDGEYYIVEDDFKSAEEAWKRYDELVKENKL